MKNELKASKQEIKEQIKEIEKGIEIKEREREYSPTTKTITHLSTILYLSQSIKGVERLAGDRFAGESGVNGWFEESKFSERFAFFCFCLLLACSL